MKNKGFTIIELLASMAIIALLATIIIPSTIKLIEKSNIKKCETTVDILLSNAELCYLDKMEICYGNDGEGRDVSLYDLYINGYIDEKEIESESTGITIDNSKSDTALTSGGHYKIGISKRTDIDIPKYEFKNKTDFCGS